MIVNQRVRYAIWNSKRTMRVRITELEEMVKITKDSIAAWKSKKK